MAGSVQSGVEVTSHDSANGSEKPHLAGSIVLGLMIGAVAGILVGGLAGIHESSSGSIQVVGTSVSQQTAP